MAKNVINIRAGQDVVAAVDAEARKANRTRSNMFETLAISELLRRGYELEIDLSPGGNVFAALKGEAP